MNALLAYRDPQVSEAIEAARKSDSVVYHDRYRDRLHARNCPLCGSTRRVKEEPYAGGFPVARCVDCGMLYAPQILLGDALADYYSRSASATLLNAFYASRTTRRGVSAERVECALAWLVVRYAECHKPVRVLDVGAGDGGFLHELGQRLSALGIHFEVLGVEASAQQVSIALKRGVSVVHGVVGEMPLAEITGGSKFDLICFFELIEHLPFPSAFIQECAELLSDRGCLLFSTPNVDGFENLLTGYNGYRQLAHAMAPPAHINAFSSSNIRLFLYLNGFAIRDFSVRGLFDAPALQVYRDSKKAENDIGPELAALADLPSPTVQFLINMLNGSSTMRILAEKRL